MDLTNLHIRLQKVGVPGNIIVVFCGVLTVAVLSEGWLRSVLSFTVVGSFAYILLYYRSPHSFLRITGDKLALTGSEEADRIEFAIADILDYKKTECFYIIQIRERGKVKCPIPEDAEQEFLLKGVLDSLARK